MTLYRFPVNELQRYNFKLGQTPFLPAAPDSEDEEETEKYETKAKDWPEESLFHLSDLVDYYKQFALKDERIKDFVEKIKDFVEQMSHQPLHYFQIS